MRMPRPPFVPKTEEQRAAIAALDQALQHAEAERERAKGITDAASEKVWQAARAARAVGVSAKYIGEVTGRGRTTVHRHVPPPGQNEAESGD